MLPFHLARARGGRFDPRLVTLLALRRGGVLAAGWSAGARAALTAAALVLGEPARLLAADLRRQRHPLRRPAPGRGGAAERGRPLAAAALLGLACATKQLAWPFAPFLLAASRPARASLARPRRPALARAARGRSAVAAAVFAAVVLPVAALDFRAFWARHRRLQRRPARRRQLPAGRHARLRLRELPHLLRRGRQPARPRARSRPSTCCSIPLGLLLAARQLRERRAAGALLAGGAALLASLYFSRVVHPNYLILAATLLPVALLMRARRPRRRRGRCRCCCWRSRWRWRRARCPARLGGRGGGAASRARARAVAVAGAARRARPDARSAGPAAQRARRRPRRRVLLAAGVLRRGRARAAGAHRRGRVAVVIVPGAGRRPRRRGVGRRRAQDRWAVSSAAGPRAGPRCARRGARASAATRRRDAGIRLWQVPCASPDASPSR